MREVCHLPPWQPAPEGPEGFSREAAVAAARACLATGDCTFCDVCQLLCPDLAITRDPRGHIQIDLDYCKGCGLCAYFCPKGAMRMEAERG